MVISERLRSATTMSGPQVGNEPPRLGEFASLVGGKWTKTGSTVAVSSPYDGSLAAIVHRAGPREISGAISASVSTFQITRKLPTWKRTEILDRISAGIGARREEFARSIALEAGKPIRTARVEVDRAIFTFKVAAEEARRLYGEIVPLDWMPGGENREAQIRRVPLGPILGITPFNYPLNLVAHKVAPAIAAGDTIIIRPASQTPITALMLGEVVMESGLPQGALSVIPCATEDATALVQDDRLKLLTFTGSPAVGWGLKTRAGRKRVTLELGGNAGVIVHKDADVDYAAERVTWGGFSYAGQSCISVQRVYVHADVYDRFRDALLNRVTALKVGDPLDDETDVGPVIDSSAADRIEEWVKEAIHRGANVIAGGSRTGNLWHPTVLTDLEEDMSVYCKEVFAPVVGLQPYGDVHAAIAAVNRSEFGLQAGVFTNDYAVIREAFEEIEVGGLMVNDVSSFRMDHMPYGGVKMSGLGREGLRYAIEEMTEMKLLTFNSK